MGSGGNFDFKEMELFRDQLETMKRKQDEFCQSCVRELAEKLLLGVVNKTPVGRPPKLETTKRVKVKGTGKKSAASLSGNAAILKQYWSGYQGGSLRRAWTMGEIRKTGETYEIEIINPAEYASSVEYGHRQKPGRYVPMLGKQLKKSWVPAQLMMTISERQIRAMAPGVLRKRLEEWLKGGINVK